MIIRLKIINYDKDTALIFPVVNYEIIFGHLFGKDVIGIRREEFDRVHTSLFQMHGIEGYELYKNGECIEQLAIVKMKGE